MSRPIIFGEIPGIEEGQWFEGRKEMMPTSFHRRWGSGIDGNAKEGTSAIVLSGGYEDDFDDGDEIIYTGAGGNDPNTGKQIKDSSFKSKFITELEVESGQSQNKKCPICKTADVVLRKSGTSKNGNTYKFYGCTNYLYGCNYMTTEWINN
jgi:hypothetical protein